MSRWLLTCILLLECLGLGSCAPYTATRGLSFAEAYYPMETRLLDVDGLQIAISEKGEGERTLLLIHGLGSNMTFWNANFDFLAEHYHVVALDLPGYGRSSKANYEYSMAFFARAVEAVIEKLQLEMVTLVGHSMGGQIAITHALMFPGKADGLILVSPAGLEKFGPGEGAWLSHAVTAKFLMAKDAESVYAGIAANFVDLPREAGFLVEQRLSIIDGPDYADYSYANSRSVTAMIDGPVYKRLGAIKVPVLVVFGESDGLIPNSILHGGSTAAVARNAAKLPNARLEMIPKAGHMVQFERADLFNPLVIEYLEEGGKVK